MEPSLKRKRIESKMNQIKEQNKITIGNLNSLIREKDNINFKLQSTLHNFSNKLDQKEEEIKNLNKQNQEFRRIFQTIKQDLNICLLERPTISRNTKTHIKNCIDNINTVPNRVVRVLNFSNTGPN